MKQIIFTIRSKEIPFEGLPQSQQKVFWEMTSSVISLIAALSEAHEEINQAITKRFYITEFLIVCLATPDLLTVSLLK